MIVFGQNHGYKAHYHIDFLHSDRLQSHKAYYRTERPTNYNLEIN